MSRTAISLEIEQYTKRNPPHITVYYNRIVGMSKEEFEYFGSITILLLDCECKNLAEDLRRKLEVHDKI